MLSDYVVGTLIYLGLVAVIMLLFNGAYKIDKYDYYEEKGEDEHENF